MENSIKSLESHESARFYYVRTRGRKENSQGYFSYRLLNRIGERGSQLVTTKPAAATAA
jgi:hypothetical protein